MDTLPYKSGGRVVVLVYPIMQVRTNCSLGDQTLFGPSRPLDTVDMSTVSTVAIRLGSVGFGPAPRVKQHGFSR